jgi:hypothetical protein
MTRFQPTAHRAQQSSNKTRPRLGYAARTPKARHAELRSFPTGQAGDAVPVPLTAATVAWRPELG